MRLKTTLAALLAATALAAPATARAATPDQILSGLAANQTHSWVDDGIGFPAMLAKVKAGERLYVTCGNVAEIGRELLVEQGYRARVVQIITREPFDHVNDGHIMLEVWDAGRWQLYDPDSNDRAIDIAGQGVSLDAQINAVQAGTAHWQTIATDPLWNTAEPSQASLAIAEQVFSDPAAFYRHVFGVALIPIDPAGQIGYGAYFHAPDQTQRLYDYDHGYRVLLDDAQWTTVTTTTNAPAFPAPAAPAATAAPVAAPAPAPPPVSVAVDAAMDVAVPAPAPAVATPRHVRKRRFVTVVRHGRVFHVYRRAGHKPRWVFVRRLR